MYHIGDLIFYANTGVCKITGITTRKQTKTDQEECYYVLEPQYQKCTIFAPVNATNIFMRPIISKSEAEQLIDSIPAIQAKIYHNYAFGHLAEHYKEAIQTHSCLNLIELTLSIYTKKQIAKQSKRKLGAVDERFMRQAEELLFGELSVALDLSKDDVPEYIANRVGLERRNHSNGCNS